MLFGQRILLEEEVEEEEEEEEDAFSSMILYVHRDHTDYEGRRAQDVHIDFHTAPEL